MPFLVQGIENVNIGDILRNIGKICLHAIILVVLIYFQYIFYFLRKIDQEMGY